MSSRQQLKNARKRLLKVLDPRGSGGMEYDAYFAKAMEAEHGKTIKELREMMTHD